MGRTHSPRNAHAAHSGAPAEQAGHVGAPAAHSASTAEQAGQVGAPAGHSASTAEQPDHVGAPAGHIASAAEQVGAAAERVVKAVKPILRGWIHTVTAPLALAACIVLIVLTPAPYRWTTIVFGVASVVLFAMSAVYHRGDWSPGVTATLRRLDHSNIFLLIAGTYTPLSWLLLERPTAYLVLGIVWGGALAGIILKVLWLGAPRWLYVPIYVALGWVAVWFLPAFRDVGGSATMWLVIAGGIAYTVGAIAYALKWPNPSPRWFGFHEVFHAGTVIGWVCHFIAAAMAVASLR